jgi:hypothetical protein
VRCSCAPQQAKRAAAAAAAARQAWPACLLPASQSRPAPCSAPQHTLTQTHAHTPHCHLSQDKPLDFYEQFHVVVLGLDSLEARRYMNSVACSFLGGRPRAWAVCVVRACVCVCVCVGCVCGVCVWGVCVGCGGGGGG